MLITPTLIALLLPVDASGASTLASFDPAYAPPAPLSFQTYGSADQPSGYGYGGTGGSNFSYTYAELDYRYVDSEIGGDSVDGLALRGSYEVNPNLYFLASFSRLSDDGDLDEYRLGGGYKMPVSDRIDVFGQLSFVREEYDLDDNDDSENGFSLEAGARMWLTEQVEVNNRLEYRDVADNGWGVGIGARYYVSPMVSLGGEFEAINGNEDLLLGVRFQW